MKAVTDGDSESRLLIPDSGAVPQWSGRASESESANDDSESAGPSDRRKAGNHTRGRGDAWTATDLGIGSRLAYSSRSAGRVISSAGYSGVNRVVTVGFGSRGTEKIPCPRSGVRA